MGNFRVSVWHHLKENNSSKTAMNEKTQMLKTEIMPQGDGKMIKHEPY